MLKFIVFCVSLFLIFIIFLRIPEEDVGLLGFTTNSNLLGSPASGQRFLNNLTSIFVLIYFLIAFKLNLEN
jgi:preprotein translocase subunit SecG